MQVRAKNCGSECLSDPEVAVTPGPARLQKRKTPFGIFERIDASYIHANPTSINLRTLNPLICVRFSAEGGGDPRPSSNRLHWQWRLLLLRSSRQLLAHQRRGQRRWPLWKRRHARCRRRCDYVFQRGVEGGSGRLHSLHPQDLGGSNIVGIVGCWQRAGRRQAGGGDAERCRQRGSAGGVGGGRGRRQQGFCRQ